MSQETANQEIMAGQMVFLCRTPSGNAIVIPDTDGILVTQEGNLPSGHICCGLAMNHANPGEVVEVCYSWQGCPSGVMTWGVE